MPFLGSNRLFSLNRPRLYAPQKMRAKKKQKKRTRRRSWPNKKNGTCRVSSLKKDIFGTLFFLEKPINPSLVLFVSRQNGREGKNYIRRYLFVFLYFFFHSDRWLHCDWSKNRPMAIEDRLFFIQSPITSFRLVIHWDSNDESGVLDEPHSTYERNPVEKLSNLAFFCKKCLITGSSSRLISLDLKSTKRHFFLKWNVFLV